MAVDGIGEIYCICLISDEKRFGFSSGEARHQAGPIPSTWSRWKTMVLSPAKCDRETNVILILRWGGAFSAEEAHEILQHTVTFIADFLQQNPSNILLCEDRFFAINDRPNLSESQIFRARRCYLPLPHWRNTCGWLQGN